MKIHNALFNAARLSEKAGKPELAATFYSRSARGVGGERAQALYRLANLEFKNGDLEDARQLLEEALELDSEQPAWHYRLAMIQEKEGDKETALSHYRSASAMSPSNAAWADKLKRYEDALRISKAKSNDDRAKAMRKRGLRWQELELLESSAESFTRSADWFVRYGDALEAMNRFEEAAKAFRKANQLRPGHAVPLFREGRCWRLAGEKGWADQAFKKAKHADKDLDSASLGIGVFFEHRGMWPEAAAQYEVDCTRAPDNAELQFRAGRAHERCYRWDAAAFRYGEALALDPFTWRNHFRLGFVHERAGNLPGAEDAYTYGLELAGTETTATRYWAYRLGVVREQLGKISEAVDAYSISMKSARAVSTDGENTGSAEEGVPSMSAYEQGLLKRMHYAALRSADATHLEKVAHEFENRRMWKEAADCLQAAVDRKQTFDAAVYFRLGQAYSALGDEQSAARAFQATRISVQARGIDGAKYRKDAALQKLFEYAEMSENLPLRDNVILYESFFGKQITCNPYALFRDIYGDPEYAHFLHVWVVTPETAKPAWMQQKPNVVFVNRGSHLYQRFLATAKYLVNNVTFPAMFVRRDGQRYLNTWHGTPMKTLGKDIGTGVLEHRNVSRNFLHATHIAVPNEHTRRILLERYDVNGLTNANVALTGYPRVDLTLGAESEGRVRSIRYHLGLEEEGRKVVLYAPTWRGGANHKHFDTARLVADLEALAQLDCVVLFQGHHLSVSLLPDELPVRVVDEDINTNELLSVVDVLITDYSSILFDFLPARRAVITYTYDLDAYSAERGLYLTPKDLGLPQVESIEALVHAVRESLADPEAYTASSSLIDEFCGLEDGSASERVKKFFLDDDMQNEIAPPPRKRRLLFHHSMLPNGISSSLINLLKSLDAERYDATVVVPAGSIEKNERSISLLNALPENVRVLADAGRQLVNIEEKWLIDAFNRWNKFPSEGHEKYYKRAFEREFKRLFGDVDFDVVIEFEGYSRYWTSVLAAAPATCRKIMYLHNDMVAEWRVKFPYLRGVFEMYSSFEVLASVSPALSDLNRSAIKQIVDLDPRMFMPIINQINADGTLALSREPLDEDLADWFSRGGTSFITMGRLSKEKDQAKLLRALSKVVQAGHQVSLALLGEGPLHAELQSLVDELQLQKHVYFAGQRENPFPALRAADCLVLPSNHEGQPMVLLEAMLLGKRIIATDIPGSRQVLSENTDFIVANSESGLIGGMVNEAAASVPAQPVFDAKLYMETALNDFIKVCAFPADVMNVEGQKE